MTPKEYRQQHTKHRHETGFVLVTALILLLVMTIIGIAASQNTTLEEKMAGNQRERDQAFQAAEAALRDGQNYLALNTLPAFNNTNGFYQYQLTPPLWSQVNWSSSSTATISYSGTLSGLNTQPRYYVEELPPAPAPGQDLAQPQYGNTPPLQFFRVTSRGIGNGGNAIVILQSAFRP